MGVTSLLSDQSQGEGGEDSGSGAHSRRGGEGGVEVLAGEHPQRNPHPVLHLVLPMPPALPRGGLHHPGLRERGEV